MKRFLFGSALLLGIIALFSCTPDFDWTGIKFPCSETRACATGYECQAGFCVAKGATPTPTDVKIAFLYVGPVGDFGWTWAHEQGRLYLKNLGYDTTAAESISIKDAPQQMEDFISKGYNFIIGTSHDFLVPQLSTASKHPNLKFLNCSGFEVGANIGSYFGRLYQIEWLAGMIAGTMTKTNRIGIVTTVAIPEIVRHVNAFANGVRAVNKDAVVILKWVGNWFDPKNEPILTQELLDVDADVIHSHTDTSIPLELIENKGKDPLKTKSGETVHTIAYNSINGCDFGPRTCVASVYWNWGPILARILDKVKKGTWDPKDIIWEQLKNDKNDSSFHISMSPELFKLLPGQARIEIESRFPQLAKEGQEGQQLPFQGPLKDNNGKERLAAGKYLSDKDLLNMCWLAENVREPDGTPAKVPSECKGDR